jgi:hypothetical protein
MWAFSQEACVVGVFVAANAGPEKATATPSATVINKIRSMGFPFSDWPKMRHLDNARGTEFVPI